MRGSIISASDARAPGAAFVFAHPAHCIAFGFGSGLAPVAPGTVGTLVAFPLYFALAALFDRGVILALAAAGFALGIWACGRAGRALGVADHGGMNWDEIVAFLAVLVLCPAGIHWQLVAFAAFRFFDIVKPAPIRALERRVPGGLGVMLDDLVAALYTIVLLQLAHRFLG